MARRDTDSGNGIESNSNNNNSIRFRSTFNEKIEVELNQKKSFVCYPFTEATIDESEVAKIQEYIDKNYLIRVGA